MDLPIKTCSNCGAKIPISGGHAPEYCPSCGTPLAASASDPGDAYPYAEGAVSQQASPDEEYDAYPYSENAAPSQFSEPDDDAYPYSEGAASSQFSEPDDDVYPYSEGAASSRYSEPDDGAYPYSERAASSGDLDDTYPYAERASDYPSDTLSGSYGSDTLSGDALNGDSQGAYDSAQPGGQYGSDTLSGGASGGDTLGGSYGSDTLSGGTLSSDTLGGSYGGDTLSEDTLDGGTLSNSCGGDTSGGDTLGGSYGSDTLSEDTLDGGTLSDSYGGGASGSDTLGGSYGGDTLGDTLSGGTSGGDTLSASSPHIAASVAEPGTDSAFPESGGALQTDGSAQAGDTAQADAAALTGAAALAGDVSQAGSAAQAGDSAQAGSPAQADGSAPSQGSSPPAGAAPAKAPSPPPEEEPVVLAAPRFSSSVKLSHYLGLTGTTNEAEPVSYINTLPSTLLAILKFLGAAAAAFAIVVSVSVLMPLITDMMSGSASVENIRDFANQITAAYEAQLPGIGAFLSSIPGVDSILTAVSNGFTLGQAALAAIVLVICFFLLLSVLEGLSALLLRFAAKGSAFIWLTQTIFMAASAILFILTIVVYIFGAFGMAAMEDLVPEQLKEITAGIPAGTVVIIVFACMAAGRLLDFFYHKDVAKAMKIISHDLSTGARPDTKKSLLSVISLFYAVLWAIALAAIVITIIGVGPALFETPDIGGSHAVSIAVILALPVYKLLKYILVTISYRNLMA